MRINQPHIWLQRVRCTHSSPSATRDAWAFAGLCLPFSVWVRLLPVTTHSSSPAPALLHTTSMPPPLPCSWGPFLLGVFTPLTLSSAGNRECSVAIHRAWHFLLGILRHRDQPDLAVAEPQPRREDYRNPPTYEKTRVCPQPPSD